MNILNFPDVGDCEHSDFTPIFQVLNIQYIHTHDSNNIHDWLWEAQVTVGADLHLSNIYWMKVIYF